MANAVRIRVRIKPYRWKEFVHDVFFVLYATIMISNALCKRYFKLSIPQLYHRIYDPVARAGMKIDDVGKKVVLITLVIITGIFAFIYTVGVPVVLILGALGKIQ